MTTDSSLPPTPTPAPDGASRKPRPSREAHGEGRRKRVRWIVHGVLLVALAAGVFGLLPRLGGLAQDAAALGHARPALIVAAVVSQAASLLAYALLYRSVLSSLQARLSIATSAQVILATFLISHVTPFGSVTGTLLNVDTLEAEGIAAATAGEAIALTSLVSTMALITLFGVGLLATAGRSVSAAYLAAGAVALAVVAAVLAGVLLLGAHPTAAASIGRWVSRMASRLRRRSRTSPAAPDQAGSSWAQMASLARSALTGRAFAISFGWAAADLLLDLLSLELMFAALGYQPGFGPLAVAYAAANIASVIPVTPAGLGVIEVTLVAITVGFGAPRATAVLAVIGYRLVNYWLPLPFGLLAYVQLRLRLRH
jgi:uncharacterized protein (TIRG00374 family)